MVLYAFWKYRKEFVIMSSNSVTSTAREHVFPLFVKYVSANVLGMIGYSCYILADTFFVARGIGSDAIAALSASYLEQMELHYRMQFHISASCLCSLRCFYATICWTVLSEMMVNRGFQWLQCSLEAWQILCWITFSSILCSLAWQELHWLPQPLHWLEWVFYPCISGKRKTSFIW